jgi:hypothetical protein
MKNKKKELQIRNNALKIPKKCLFPNLKRPIFPKFFPDGGITPPDTP